MAEPALSEPRRPVHAPAPMARRWRQPRRAAHRVETDKLTAMYGKFTAVKGVSLGFTANRVHALIGPSGCGKSTFLRTLNRMHELSRGRAGSPAGSCSTARTSTPPRVNRDAAPPPDRDGVPAARRRSRPCRSTTTSRPGCACTAGAPGRELDGMVERSLRQAALWDEVKDRLRASAMALSGGQQQRLCIARTIAPSPDVRPARRADRVARPPGHAADRGAAVRAQAGRSPSSS